MHIWRIAQASIADVTDLASSGTLRVAQGNVSKDLSGVRGQGINLPGSLDNTTTRSMLVFWVTVSGL